MNCYGVLLDPGPGDALRFLHGFCELLHEEKKNGMIFCTPMSYSKCYKLFHVVDCEIVLIMCEDIKRINLCLKELPDSIIWYCFDIKYINKKTKELPETITQKTRHEFRMVDRYDNQRFMKGKIKCHLSLPPISKVCKGLIFLRNMTIRPERNMNRYILNEIIEILSKRDIVYDVVGDLTEWDIDENAKKNLDKMLFESGFPDYYTQIITYKHYMFSVGMNSGGLDLALAAGVPGIRIGEFHQHYSWLGPHYNDFLSTSCTINITSRSETDVSNIGNQQICRAFEILLDDETDGIWWI